jgi:hypothetical protein
MCVSTRAALTYNRSSSSSSSSSSCTYIGSSSCCGLPHVSVCRLSVACQQPDAGDFGRQHYALLGADAAGRSRREGCVQT